MPNEEWGVKRLCPKCATRFYDLKNDPMTCPSCEFEFDLASLLDGGKAAAAKVKKEAEAAAAAEEPILDDVEDVLDDDDDTGASNDDLLDDDDDTVTLEEVKDVPANVDDN
ncbi:MAG: TIGR02300 family protein [Rhodobacteraceae bacterium]|nr:TIGR02300 family protein [Paracoccaceae bacterium]